VSTKISQPEPSRVLMNRLRSLAVELDKKARAIDRIAHPVAYAVALAHANTCWSAATRLEELSTRLDLVGAPLPGDE
jgi:hypothetical protein